MPIKKKKRRKKRKSRYHTGVYESIKTGVKYRYRSSWELLYMKYLDSNKSVITWQYESLKIPYISNKKSKKIRQYIPDFVVEFTNDVKHILEIKPQRKLKQTKILKKLVAAEQWCHDHGVLFYVITEAELRVLGLL